MSKLLRANFRRLFQNKFFQGCMIGLFCVGILFTLKRYFDIRMDPEYYAQLPDDFKCAEGFAFSGAYHIIFVVAVVIGSFVGTEFSDGTIRNKVVAGHDKKKIYLASLIVAVAASELLLLAEMVAMFLVGKIVFTASIMSAGEIIAYAFCECVSMAALSAVLVFLTMIVQNKSAGNVIVLLTVMMLFLAAMTIDDRMHLVEYYEDYNFVLQDAETDEVYVTPEIIKDPHYPEGIKREIYEFLYDVLPVCQFAQVNREYHDKIPILMGYSLLLGAAFTGGGVALFLRKDLR